MQSEKIRVMIVDDSAVIRSVINQTLSGHDDIEVSGIAINGADAVQSITVRNPDIVILDLEMPVMDGITALPLLLEKKPGVKILICSTLSARGADISLKALSLGATDCLLKPGGGSIVNAQDFQAQLLKTIRGLCPRKQNTAVVPMPAILRPQRSSYSDTPLILAIGSSTGGPKILMDLLKELRGLPIPILITQHMPKGFTTLLAQHIQQNCEIPTHEGTEGMVIEAGHVYIAPGDYHMSAKKSGTQITIHLDQNPPENYCRPAVDPMLRSLPPLYGSRILTVILTGMGSDGLEGCRLIDAAGGQIIAQDEETSTVWGMPGAVANAGLCRAVLPAEQIASWIRNTVRAPALQGRIS